MKKIIFAAPLCLATTVFAGGIGGSNPPAREDLEVMLLSRADLSEAGLFTTESGDINLGVSGALGDSLALSKFTARPQALKISDADFNILGRAEHRAKPVDAVSLGQESTVRSYTIEDGNALGELILVDRRKLIRSAVVKP